MTRISTIHGIPQDEYAGRAAMVQPSGYIPYLSLTQGEMELYLAAQRAKIRAEWYGSDAPQYVQAYQMIENALHTGVHGGIRWIQAVPDHLQDVARYIKRAERLTRPASRALFYRPAGVSGIGQTVIPYEQRRSDCINAAREKIKKLPQCSNTPYKSGTYCDVVLKSEISKCQEAFNIEKILNGGVEKSSHHVIYKQLPPGYIVPNMVANKLLYHKTGVEAMALAGDIQPALMYTWTENGVLLNNSKSAYVGPIGSIQSSVLLAPNPGASWANMATWANTKLTDKQQKVLGINGIGVVPVVPPVDPVTAALNIVAIIGGALLAAATLLKELRSAKAYAMNEVQGFGTSAFQASKNDWLTGAGNPDTVISGGLNTTTLLLLGAGAFLLLSDEN